MSGITGVIYTDGRPANVTQLAPAIEQMSILGPNGLSTWAEGSAAFAHLALHTTHEAVYEQWPLINARGDVLLADARIDNRDELLRTLTPEGGRGRGGEGVITDADLILAAHQKWGNDAPAHLVGDFAYVLWQPSKRHLLMVRSPFGMKGLYYRRERARILFATTLRGIQALDPKKLTLNYPWIASFLSFEMNHFFDESVFCEIAKVPAAHYIDISLENGSQKQQQFWSLTSHSKYAAWTDEQWVEGFRECFEQVIADSLRSNKPISMSVSGGLDSSSIALVAHRLMHEEGRVPKLPVYCYTDRMLGWSDTDESKYRNAVVARLSHFHCEWIDQESAWNWKMVEEFLKKTSMPMNLPNIFSHEARINLARKSGCRVMLAGTGGDIITGGEDYGLVNALESFSWLQALGELHYFTRGTVRGTRKLLKKLAREHLPPAWYQWLQQKRGVSEELYTLECEQMIKFNKFYLFLKNKKSDSALQRFIRSILLTPRYYYVFEQGAEVYALHGMEFRTPFYDRRLVELAFQQPIHLRIKGGNTRVLLKKALKQDLPSLLSNRDSKADFTRFIAYSISETAHARASQLKPNALTQKQGWIDLTTWQNWSTEPKWPMQTVLVHRLAHLEEWLSLLGEESNDNSSSIQDF